ncbi:MAG: enoyl-ACP reductase [Alphaproteobacteria bacterium]|nr:enoyl-ACP reductase [Alphaproteobacteria bacterium]
MRGKRGIILGVANERSLAWGIAQQLHNAGAEIAFTYFDKIDKLEDKVRKLADSIGSQHVLPCNVADDKSIANVMDTLGKEWGQIDFIVHSIAFADKDELTGRFLHTSRHNFHVSLDASAYSFIAVLSAAHEYLAKDATALTLTYLGGPRVVPNYNLMGVAKAALESSVRYLAADLGPEGIRVNAISAGPVKTVAAMGIGGFRDMLKHHEQTAPSRQATTKEHVGKAGLYLLSSLSEGVTGEIHYVDGGANILGSSLG